MLHQILTTILLTATIGCEVNQTSLPAFWISETPEPFHHPTTIRHDQQMVLSTRIDNQQCFVDESMSMENLSADSGARIHEGSMRIAGFVLQIFVYLFFFTLATVDFEEEAIEREERMFEMPVLRRAKEIQLIPLVAQPTVRRVRFAENPDIEC